MKMPHVIAIGLSAVLAFGTPAQASDEDTKKAIITAAVIAGIAALIHKHRKSGKYDGHENWEREFERGYRDGYHNNRYNNRNDSNAYREGYQAGRQATGNHGSNDDYWHDNNKKPSQDARRACIKQASKRWRVNMDRIVVGHYEAAGNRRHRLIMVSGRNRAECVVNQQGHIKQFTNVSHNNSSNNNHNRPSYIGSAVCPRNYPKGSKQCEVYKIGVNMGRADRKAHASFLPGRHSGMYNGKYQSSFMQGYRAGWGKAKARSTN